MNCLNLIPNIQSTSYLKLPNEFYEVIEPTPIDNPYLVKFNHELASVLSEDNLSSCNEEQTITLYAGNQVPPPLKSIALAYAGHQFGFYVPLLGDGRAIMLGEICSATGKRWDVQLKGSGRTMFSRMGDGRAPLTAVLREYMVSEAMHGLNIPTTRCLAAIGSDQTILRQDGPVPLGVLTRIASSSLRVGSFEYATRLNDNHLLKCLADYALERHYPELLEQEYPYLELFKGVVDRQAALIAEWMSVGFIHGVMNTDNMTISGETIDYGPCAFMDEFDLNTVFSSIDAAGRYAFGNQASIAKWNLSIFYQSLLPLFNDMSQELNELLLETLHSFADRFYHYWNKKIRAKLGLIEGQKKAKELVHQLFSLMQQHQPDFTNTFRLMSKALDSEFYKKRLISMLGNQVKSEQWVDEWKAYVMQQKGDLHQIKFQMNQVNPAYIPRNHLVERAINNYIENKDRTLMDTLLHVFKNPYQQQKNTQHLQSPPLPEERICQTFCGT